ncbi:unnamed protein product [Caenorhabditis brenneri]
MLDNLELANFRIDQVVSTFKGCHACFWLWGVCNPIVCTVLWAFNVLIVFWLLRYCVLLCIPEKRKASTISTRTNQRSSQDGGTTETANLLTQIPLTPFYMERV